MPQRTITLTGRAPVQIDEDTWPSIAESFAHDGEVVEQAIRKWTLKARQHADGRTLVYGVISSCYRNEERKGGELLSAGDDVPAAIARVGADLGLDDYLIRECVANLPAVTI